MARVVAFFSWIGVIVFGGLVLGTAIAWMNDAYQGSLTQWLLQELIQGALLGLCVWGAIGSWRKRMALPPAERSKLGMGCLVVICVVLAMAIGFAVTGNLTNRKVADEVKAVAPPVIAALARFKAAKKEYPNTLEQLVPEYLPAVPGCKPGEASPRMAYWFDASSGQYELACPSFMLTRHRYRSATGQWDVSD